MSGRTIDIIAGARPNFMKIAPIIGAIERRRASEGHLRFRLVHTGQHYDSSMSGDFFDQLGIPPPDVSLGVGSGSHAVQTAAIMTAYERALLGGRPDLCLVVGDVTSTMACAITAQKLHVPVAHVEGGIRSGDWSMPEEINRLVTDSISDHFFTTSESANRNLAASGVDAGRVHFVGNTMIDTLLANLARLRPPAFWGPESLGDGRYFVLTLHRPANVDSAADLGALLVDIADATRDHRVVFPVHPRTQRVLQDVGTLPDSIIAVPPQPYLEFNFLVRHARGVITDSGGVTEEATVLGIPCMTLRSTTERPETVSIGTNELLGSDPAALRAAVAKVLSGAWKRGGIPPLWDGRAGSRIVEALERILPAA